MTGPTYESLDGFGVSRESYQQLEQYYALLLKWQKAINLVSPASLPDAWSRHFVDSVQVLRYLPSACQSIADLGSGGGFAGLVLAICRPDISVHLIDSDMRKCQFLKTVSRESRLSNVTVHNHRVERVIQDVSVDTITARGFAGLGLIFDLTKDAREGGLDPSYVLLKGARYDEEIIAAREKYSFDCIADQSVTESQSRILRIEHVNKL